MHLSGSRCRSLVMILCREIPRPGNEVFGYVCTDGLIIEHTTREDILADTVAIMYTDEQWSSLKTIEHGEISSLGDEVVIDLA